MTRGFAILLLVMQTFCLFSQQDKNQSIQIQLKFGSEDLVVGKQYISENNDTLTFNVLRFYMSSIELNYQDNSIFKEKNSYHLIDIENPESLSIPLKTNLKRQIETIRFNIGVDSLMSVSGAMDGDLDATKGMYWAWQSGFVNMKIEGKSNSCQTRKNQFQFHVGGYLSPNYAMRTIELQNPKNQIPNDTIELVVDLAKLFSEIHLKEMNSIMIPGQKAMDLADLSISMFSLK